MTFQWHGDVFKDMKITVDTVPSFKRNSRYVIAKGNTIFRDTNLDVWNVSTCVLEQEAISQLPQHVRQGFVFAKGLRIARLFPADLIKELSLETDSIDSYLTSYMLKQALLFSQAQAQACTGPEQVAQVLYAFLKQRLTDHGSIHAFFNDTDVMFECDDALDTPPSERRACCVKRHHLLSLIQWLLRLLDVYCRTVDSA